MEKDREEDENEGGFEDIREESDLGSRSIPDESDVVEVGGSGAMDELEDIDEVEPSDRATPAPPVAGDRRPRETAAPQERREGGRGDQRQQQDRGRNDRGGRDRGRNEGRNRGRRDDRGRRDRDRDRGRDRGPERIAPQAGGVERGDGPPLDPSRESHRDLSRAGRHEPMPDEILPPEDDVAVKPVPVEEDGNEWALLEEFDADVAERGRRGDRDRGDRASADVEELGAASTGIDVLEAPRDDRGRRRGLEAGLSLRDLMPFLRPPRHVVVAGVSTGSGHARIARTVFDGLKSLDRNLTLRDVDLLDHLSPDFRPAYVRAVVEDVQRRPSLFGTPFETQPPTSSEAMPADFDDFLRAIFGEKLEQALLDRRPEWIVLSHWLPLRWLEAQAKAGATLPRIAVIASDPDFHEWWFSPVVKAWLVSNSDFQEALVVKGVEADAIQVVGVPIDPVFRSGVSREAVARQLGIRRDMPTVLLRPGGIGPAERTVALAKKLVELAVPMNLLVVAGKNDRLREQLDQIPPSQRSILKAFGFVDNIHDLMAVSDVLITRATPHTLAEAAAVGVPLVLLRPTPGVEERAADRLVAEGAAVVVRDELSLELELLDLLRNRRRLRFMHERATELSQPDGASTTVDRLTKLIR